MQLKLTNLTIVIAGVTHTLTEVTATAERVDLTITHVAGRNGLSSLDTPRVTHVQATDDSVLVEDMTEGNEEKGVVFSPMGNASEKDAPGLWGEIYGGRQREVDAGTYTTGELWFGQGECKVEVLHDPSGMTVGETGY